MRLQGLENGQIGRGPLCWLGSVHLQKEGKDLQGLCQVVLFLLLLFVLGDFNGNGLVGSSRLLLFQVSIPIEPLRWQF